MASQLENLELLANAEFLYLPASETKPLVKKGHVELNPEMKQGELTATRITEAGRAFLNSLNETPGNVAAPVKAPTMSKPVFTIETAPMPAVKRSGGAGRPSKYPFDALQVGQMFFVPCTEEQPEPAKSLGSVVTSANRRYAIETAETKTNRKGETVAKLEYQRKFTVRPFAKEIDGEIVHGAGVWREK